MDTTSDEMKEDIIKASADNNVDVFTFKRTQTNISLINYEIYGTSKVKELISEESNISQETYRSMFLGNINFIFNNLRDLDNLEKYNDYYVIGDKSNVQQFKMDLINKYAGNHPKAGYFDKESVLNIIGVWVLIMSIILLLTYYDIVCKRKENIIKITMGESIRNIFLKNVLLDSFSFITIFILTTNILSKYTNVFFYLKISIIAFLFLILFNSLLYINLYFYDIKESFSNSQSSKYMLSINYFLKLITTIITICIITSNLVLVFQGFNMYKQKDFF